LNAPEETLRAANGQLPPKLAAHSGARPARGGGVDRANPLDTREKPEFEASGMMIASNNGQAVFRVLARDSRSVQGAV
jgi:hypothetical protein